MSDKEKDGTLNDDQVNIETNNINLNNNAKKESESEPQAGDIKFLMSELNEQLEKEKKNSATVTDKWKRALADYQNLEKAATERDAWHQAVAWSNQAMPLITLSAPTLQGYWKDKFTETLFFEAFLKSK